MEISFKKNKSIASLVVVEVETLDPSRELVTYRVKQAWNGKYQTGDSFQAVNNTANICGTNAMIGRVEIFVFDDEQPPTPFACPFDEPNENSIRILDKLAEEHRRKNNP